MKFNTIITMIQKELKIRILDLIKKLAGKVLANPTSINRIVKKPVIDKLLKKALGRTLDVGCGGGMFTFELLCDRSGEVVAIDISRKHVELVHSRARIKNIKNINVVQSSIYDIPLIEDLFNIVFCTEVIEHLQDDDRAISELQRVLKPGGLLLISTPVLPNIFYDPAHVRQGYTEKELSAKLANFGFDIVAVEYCIFKLSQIALKLYYLLKIPMPVLFLSHIERRFPKLSRLGKPMDMIMLCKKRLNE